MMNDDKKLSPKIANILDIPISHTPFAKYSFEHILLVTVLLTNCITCKIRGTRKILSCWSFYRVIITTLRCPITGGIKINEGGVTDSGIKKRGVGGGGGGSNRNICEGVLCTLSL